MSSKINKNNMKISFDFDGTLTIDDVKKFAEQLINDNHEVWIVTSRYEFTDKEGNKVSNDDLFELANNIGVQKEHIHFCNYNNKSKFLKNKNFLWHLDDDLTELFFISTDTNVFPIWRQFDNDWCTTGKNLISMKHKI
jgi:hypothetical protein